MTQGNFCLNKIPLVSLLRMYRGAAQEQEKQLGGYCGNPGEMKEPWDEGDSSGDGENRLDLDLG